MYAHVETNNIYYNIIFIFIIITMGGGHDTQIPPRNYATEPIRINGYHGNGSTFRLRFRMSFLWFVKTRLILETRSRIEYKS